MTREKIFRMIFALLLFSCLWGCDSQSGVAEISSVVPTSTVTSDIINNEFNEQILINISNINQDLIIVKIPSEHYSPSEINDKVGGYVAINNTPENILIPKESLEMAYAYDSTDGVWIKVSVDREYLVAPEPLELQPFTGDWKDTGYISVYLEPSLVSSVELVRLAVIGQSGSSGELVGAWLDVPWQPAD